MKSKLFRFEWVVLLTVIFFVFSYFSLTLPNGQPTVGYSTVPDAEADYLISVKVFRGEGLYSSFSILYPPGRFFWQGLLFHLVSPTFTVMSVAHISVALVFFTAALFVMSFYLFRVLFEKVFDSVIVQNVGAYFFGLVSAALYVIFVRNAQEVHIFAALFFSILLASKKLGWLRMGSLGILFGVTWLFRIDAGILLTLTVGAVVVKDVLKKPIRITKHALPFGVGFGVVWLPSLLTIIFNGSLINFLYDAFVLGLLIQPKFMSLPIPENELGLVFLSSLIFVMTASIGIFLDAQHVTQKTHRFGVQMFAVFAALSYVAALGRSDEPHLWYGLVWVSPLALFVGYRILFGLWQKERILFPISIGSAALLYGYSGLMLKIKSPILFLLSVSIVFAGAQLLRSKLLRQKFSPVLSILISGTLITLLIFHSVSYLKLRRYLPRPRTLSTTFEYDWLTTEGTEIGGLEMQPDSESVLKNIRADIPKEEQYLFIFPKNILLYEYFQLQNPTRYIILTAERSNRTEQEVIERLLATDTRYFLIFPEAAELREGPVWKWILANTQIVREYRFGEEPAHLRIRTNSSPQQDAKYYLD